MDKAKQPQQLSFSFDDPLIRQTVASVALAQVNLGPASDAFAERATVYDFQSAASKRKESTEAMLYRKILDSVRHIG